MVLHILICLALAVFRSFRILKCDRVSIFITFLVPVAGFIMLVLKALSDKNSDRMADEITVGRPTADEGKRSVIIENSDKDVVPLGEALAVNDAKTRREIMMDILYGVNKSIVVENDELKEKVVPIEEALVVNDTATRRNLIIDVLYSGPNDYVSQLHDAKENTDTEVVHYAATALAEIQKEFDLKFQELEERRAKDPDDEETENEYQGLLESYILSGLLSGDALDSQLKQYREILKRKLKRKKVKGRWTLLNKKADADLRLKDSAALDEDIALMTERWPEHENVYLYKLKSAMLKRDRDLVRGIINEIKEKNIYLSAELRSQVQYLEPAPAGSKNKA